MVAGFDYVHPVFRPPSEAQSLILQVTVGCSQNHCRFCGMYKMKRFRIRNVQEILKEIRSVPVNQTPFVQRVFLADGDALVYPQHDLKIVLDELSATFPRLTRVGAYASPKSLTTKSIEELRVLQERKLRILYFGLESGDPVTLNAVNKGYGPEEMLALCLKAKQAGVKISVTAILGLAGRERSSEHAIATADWITALSPEYFSLLTLFHRHNDEWFRSIRPLTHGEILREVLTMLQRLKPEKTILRSNHVSNFLNLAGSYPKDRQRLIDFAEAAEIQARNDIFWYNKVPDYVEEYL